MECMTFIWVLSHEDIIDATAEAVKYRTTAAYLLAILKSQLLSLGTTTTTAVYSIPVKSLSQIIASQSNILRQADGVPLATGIYSILVKFLSSIIAFLSNKFPVS